MNIDSYLKSQSKKIEKALDRVLPKVSEYPQKLFEAMQYAVTSGGKRVRPVLVLGAARAVGGSLSRVMPAACAIELIHSYSLVHDDLPCMDNDDTRRGKPSCHKKYGEDTALLAGDALLTLAFQILSSTHGERSLKALFMVAEAAGARGMVGGQQVDMQYKGKDMDLPAAEYINVRKSGELIAVSTRVGAFLGGGTKAQVATLYQYGKYLGLLFQIVDDILDKEGYAKIIGVSEARREAEALRQKAGRCLAGFGGKAEILNALADFVLERNH